MTSKDLRGGYRQGLIELVQAGDTTKLVVRFAQHCVAKGISVPDVAAEFGVSRYTVYNWFKGVYTPSKQREARMLELMSRV